MSRPNKPWYRKSRKAWFVTIRGTLHNLGPDKDVAYYKFYELMNSQEEDPAPPAFGSLVQKYLEYLKVRLTPHAYRTAANYLNKLVPLIETAGEEISPEVLERAILGRKVWGPTTQRGAFARVLSMYKWAIKRNLAVKNPARGIRWPTERSRAFDSVPSFEDLQMIIAKARPWLKDILITLYDTGARPIEVASVTAEQFRPEHKIWILPEHKTVGKTRESRTVYLTDQVVDICRRNARRFPKGPIFRGQRGGPITDTNNIAVAFGIVRDALGLPKAITPYGLRHGFITEALTKGVPDTVVAALAGHRSTQMIHQFYSHVSEQTKDLREALEKFRQSDLGLEKEA